ncbi:hypothetical protein Hanom_Chr06g00495871 [Helianthus anomalus]
MSNRNSGQQFPQLIIVPYRQQNMSRCYPVLLVIPSCISRQFQHLCKVFQDGSEVNRSTGSDTLCIPAVFEETADSADGKLKTGFDGAGDGLLPWTASFATCGTLLSFSGGFHLGFCCCVCFCVWKWFLVLVSVDGEFVYIVVIRW